MYRIVKMSGKVYALEIDNIEDDIENIEEFISTGDSVILCEDLSDLYDLGIEKDEIVIVEKD